MGVESVKHISNREATKTVVFYDKAKLKPPNHTKLNTSISNFTGTLERIPAVASA